MTQQSYGKGSRTNGKSALGREQLVEIMRFLGWHTHEENGKLSDECYHVSASLAGKVTESVVLPTLIAQAVDEYRKATGKDGAEDDTNPQPVG